MHELRLILTAVALIAAMVLADRVGRRERIGAIILLLISLAWLTVDKPWEIAVLVRLSHSHGLTVSDLVGLAGLARGTWLLCRRGQRRSIQRTVPPPAGRDTA